MNKDDSVERNVAIKIGSFIDEFQTYDFKNTDQTGTELIFTAACAIKELQDILLNKIDEATELQTVLDEAFEYIKKSSSEQNDTIRELRNKVLGNMDAFQDERLHHLKVLGESYQERNTIIAHTNDLMTSLHVQKDIIEKVLTDKWIEAENPRRKGTDATKQKAILWQEKINDFVADYAKIYPYDFVGDECLKERELKSYVDTKLLQVRDDSLRTKTGKFEGKFRPPVVSKVKIDAAIKSYNKKKASLWE